MPDIVIVDRSSPLFKPAYCVHGETFCGRCQHACWLGSQTVKAVQNGAVPLCLTCASDLHDQGLMPRRPTRHVEDHRRADGPH